MSTMSESPSAMCKCEKSSGSKLLPICFKMRRSKISKISKCTVHVAVCMIMQCCSAVLQCMIIARSFVTLLAVSAALRRGLSQCTACPQDTETAFEARAGSGPEGRKRGSWLEGQHGRG